MPPSPDDHRRALPRRRRALVAVAAALLLAGALGGRAGAVEVGDLYTAQVPVTGKEAEDREAALGRALQQVLVKVTGLSDPTTSPQVTTALGRPSAYLQQYRYETVTEPDDTGTAVPRQVLSVKFDAKAVDDLLLSAGLPIWSRERPAVLLWLAADEGGQRTLVGPTDTPQLAAEVQAAASRRGLPVLLPLLDLEDRRQLDPADVWAGATDAVARASARYGVKAVLVGRASSVGDRGYEGRWTLLVGAAPQAWSSQGPTMAAALDGGIEGAAQRLAARFAQRDVTVAPVSLTITGIATLEDYARALAYLGSLDVVTALGVKEASGESVSFELEVRGGRDALAQVIGLGRTLAADPGDVSARTFRLLPAS